MSDARMTKRSVEMKRLGLTEEPTIKEALDRIAELIEVYHGITGEYPKLKSLTNAKKSSAKKSRKRSRGK